MRVAHIASFRFPPTLAADVRATPHWGEAQVLENGGSHRGDLVRLIRAVGTRLFCLAECSPDLNPVAQLSAKLKY
jgi:transposase